MGQPLMATRISLRLDFDGDRRLGPGKIALLEAIQATGSIAAAGRRFGMSYRRAWLLSDDLNTMFAQPLVSTRGGGKNGGGASLTPLGAEIVALYREAETKIHASTAEDVAKIERALADKSSE